MIERACAEPDGCITAISPELLAVVQPSSPDPAMEAAKEIAGALKSAIDAHGPITIELIPSATKRVLPIIAAAKTDHAEAIAEKDAEVERLKKFAVGALYDAYITLWTIAPGAWDSMDSLDAAISALTGLEDAEVSQEVHRRTKHIKRQESREKFEARQSLRTTIAALAAELERRK